MKQNIALVDHQWGGHHEMYLKLYTKLLLELGHSVIVVTPGYDEFKTWIGEEYAGRQPDLIGVRLPDLNHTPLIPIYRSAQKLHAKWGQVSSILKGLESQTSKRIDLVFFNYLDDMLEPIPKLVKPFLLGNFEFNFSGLLFHVHDLMEESQSVSGHLMGFEAVLQHSKSRALATLVETKVNELQTLTGKQVVAFPDIAYNQLPENPDELELVQQIQQKASGRKVVALMGTIAARKGVVPLLKAAELMQDKDFLFVIAGKTSEAFNAADLAFVKNKIENPPDNVMFITQRTTDAEFDAVINLADVLYAAYLGFQSSSNMLAKASLLQTPVLVSAGTLMEQRVAKYEIGAVTKEGDIDEIQIRVAELANKPKREFTDGFAALLAEHSEEMQKQKFIELLAEI